MIDSSPLEGDPLNALAEDFVARYRRGERPPLSEYVSLHPQLETRIRELFPTLVLMEQLGSTKNDGLAEIETPLPCQMGDFRLLREVGRGGMGIVYEAVQESLGRRVAVKVLPPALHRGKARERFEREARAAARLHHTNIVPVFGVGEHEGIPFFVMQFLDGRGLDGILNDLRTVLGHKGDANYFRHVAHLGAQAADALAYAHAQGVLHRDIKPSNLVLDSQGTLWITDFGLAKADDDAALTEQGDVVGTLRYLAPERFRGRSDARSDVYALGATLYELLTLHPLFAQRDRLQLIACIAQQTPLRPRHWTPTLPVDLETIVLKTIAADPADRYPNAAALAEDLRRFLADRPILARLASPWEALRRWRRRNPMVAALSGAVALLLILLALGSALAALFLSRTAADAREAEHVALERLLESSLAQARNGRMSGRLGQSFETWKVLEQAIGTAHKLGKRPADLIPLRNEAIASLTLSDMRLRQEWEGNPPGTNGLAFDPRFALYAWSFKDEGICIRRTDDHRELFRLPLPRPANSFRWVALSFSSQSRFLAVHFAEGPTPFSLQIWDLQSEGRQPLLTIPDCPLDPSFSPDERLLAVGRADRSITFFDLPSGRETKRLPSTITPSSLCFHPDGRKIAAGSIPNRTVQIRDRQSGKVESSLSLSANVYAMDWHPNGRTLAIGDGDRNIHLWDTESKNTPTVLQGHTWGIKELAFDSSGDHLLSFGWDMTFRLWDTRSPRLLVTIPDVRTAGIRRDGSLMAAALSGSHVRLWDRVSSPIFRVLHGPPKPMFEIEFSPDSRVMATTGEDPDVRLWDVATARELAHLPHGSPSPDARLHPLGQSHALWEPTGDGLLTRGNNGLLRWPLRRLDQTSPSLTRIGPPRLLAKSSDTREFGYVDRCGPGLRSLAIVDQNKSSLRVVSLDEPSTVLWSREVPYLVFISGSSDGRWLAGGTFDGGTGIRVWDARSGRLEKEWPIGEATVQFSPDARWLAACTGRFGPCGAECRIWRVGSWEEAACIPIERSSSTPPAMKYSPDGSLLAVTNAMEDVRLLHPETLEEIATLVSPEPLLVTRFNFSPDSSQFAACAGNRIHLWDLRVIRQRLRELNLDWDAPAYPSAVPSLPLSWSVDLGQR